MRRIQIFALGVIALLAIGCDAGDTSGNRNYSQSDVDKAVESRIKAIEENPNLTPEQKEQMISLEKGQVPGRDKSAR